MCGENRKMLDQKIQFLPSSANRMSFYSDLKWWEKTFDDVSKDAPFCHSSALKALAWREAHVHVHLSPSFFPLLQHKLEFNNREALILSQQLTVPWCLFCQQYFISSAKFCVKESTCGQKLKQWLFFHLFF